MVLESVCRRPHFYETVCYLKVFFNYGTFQREYRKSGHTFFTEYHILWKIWLGIITDIGGFYVKMPNPCPNCSSSALFCFIFFGICFDKCHVLQKTRDLMKYKITLNPSLWESDFAHLGDKKAGTSRSHDVWTGLIRVTPNSSESDQNLEKTKRNKWLVTSPEIRVVVFFFWMFFFLGVWIKLTRVNLGGSETDQSVWGARHMLLWRDVR